MMTQKIRLELSIAKHDYSNADDIKAMQKVLATMGYSVKDDDLIVAYRYWSNERYAASWDSLSDSAAGIEKILREIIEMKYLEPEIEKQLIRPKLTLNDLQDKPKIAGYLIAMQKAMKKMGYSVTDDDLMMSYTIWSDLVHNTFWYSWLDDETLLEKNLNEVVKKGYLLEKNDKR